MNQSLDTWESRYARRAARMKASETRELLKLLDRPNIVSFAGGIPDPEIFPTKQSAKICAQILGTPELAGPALQYSFSKGYEPLRRWITGYITTLGVSCESENILITSGSQQALDFLRRLFLSPGDTALVPFPTYLGALQAFNAYEPEYQALEASTLVDNASVREYALELAEKFSSIRLAYAVPDFDNPTGRQMSEQERENFIALSDELDIPKSRTGRILHYNMKEIPRQR